MHATREWPTGDMDTDLAMLEQAHPKRRLVVLDLDSPGGFPVAVLGCKDDGVHFALADAAKVLRAGRHATLYPLRLTDSGTLEEGEPSEFGL